VFLAGHPRRCWPTATGCGCFDAANVWQPLGLVDDDAWSGNAVEFVGDWVWLLYTDGPDRGTCRPRH